MRKTILLVLFGLYVFGAFAQPDPADLFILHTATTAQMNTLSPEVGALIFNTDNNSVYRYDGTSWQVVGDDGDWTVSGNDQYAAVSGNVGIGTNTPAAKLDVNGILRSISQVSPTSGVGAELAWDGIYALLRGYDRTNSQYKPVGLSGSEVRLFVDGSEAVTVNNAKDVGIGTTMPGGNLHVSSGTSGDATIIIEADTDNDNENDNPLIIFRQDGGINESAIEQMHNTLHIRNSVGADGGLVFDVGDTDGYENATEAMRITPSGDIGMGTASPAKKLDVQGSIAHTGALYSRGPNNTFPWMRFEEHYWGNSLVLGAGGRTILGGGEFAFTAQPHFSVSGEDLILGSDYNVDFYTNTQSGWADNIHVMRITNTGRVGIRTVSPTAELDVNGTLRVRNVPAGSTSQWLIIDGSGNVRVQASDRRLKKDIEPIKNALDKVIRLDGKYFTWKKDNQRDIGFIAQDVEKVLPELVHETSDGYKSLNYPQITALLANAIKELKAENDRLRNMVNTLEQAGFSASIRKDGSVSFSGKNVFSIEHRGPGHWFVRFRDDYHPASYSVTPALTTTVLADGSPAYINLGKVTPQGFDVRTLVSRKGQLEGIDLPWNFRLDTQTPDTAGLQISAQR